MFQWLKLKVEKFKLEIICKCSTLNVINNWKNLPKSTVSSLSFEVFKLRSASFLKYMLQFNQKLLGLEELLVKNLLQIQICSYSHCNSALFAPVCCQQNRPVLRRDWVRWSIQPSILFPTVASTRASGDEYSTGQLERSTLSSPSGIWQLEVQDHPDNRGASLTILAHSH